MKNRIYFLLVILFSFLVSCQDESMYHDITRPDDTMHLQVSAESIELNQELGREDAVTFSWNAVTNVDRDAKVTYYFKMDIADNDFVSSIDKIKVPEGSNSLSFTHKKLNALLGSWKVEAGESVTLEAEIIAEIEGTSQYVKPELSTVRFNVVGYQLQPYDIFVVGTAIDGLDPAKAVKMAEEIPEERYVWSGIMKQGSYKFILSNTSLSPSYTQGAGQGSVVFNETETGNETLFSVKKDGFYSLILNIETGTLEAVYPAAEYDNIWMIGAATPAGWEIMNAVKLKKDPINQVAFYYEGWLNTGEMKFPLELRADWSIAVLMPIENGTNENGDNRMERIEPGGHDYKWNISKAANYRVTLNTYTMTIEFEESKQEIPEGVPYKTIWIFGDATTAGWDLNGAAKQMFVYDYDAAKQGIFTWQGDLKAGTFKFPLNLDGYGDIDYLMPSNADGEGFASLAETSVQYVSRNENKDYQWKVKANEAGEYLITLNVMNKTVEFKCLNKAPIIPEDLVCKEVWMFGDATPANWDQGKQPFTYDFNAAEKGIFYWEGELKAGAFKCPINVDNNFKITCFMPYSVKEGEDWAPLTETRTRLVEPGGVDYKWKVEENEAGNYRVVLNVVNNTIKFIKK
ncbi:MAG TPA: SusF/SusE family outer membrane protein [Bacteroides reticulotermitis]|nr:SusF/SusE family outer membrane protein [Bacteroides reticulotermitis]